MKTDIPNIDQMLRDMARHDGYDARKLVTHDELVPDEMEVNYEREPVAADAVFGAAVLCVCLIAGVCLAAWAWLMN